MDFNPTRCAGNILSMVFRSPAFDEWHSNTVFKEVIKEQKVVYDLTAIQIPDGTHFSEFVNSLEPMIYRLWQ